MSYHPVEIVEVRAWDRSVGALARGARRHYTFEYTPEEARAEVPLAPLLMRPKTPNRVFTFPSLSLETWWGLPPMVADSLPDEFGNALIDAWMAREGVHREEITPLDRLACLGSRGMGALEFIPDIGPGQLRPTAIDLSELVVAARAAVHGSLADEEQAEDALNHIVDVGTSAGGQRAKAIINIDEATMEIRSGHLPPEPGFEPWLLKFDGMGPDQQLSSTEAFGRIEYAYSLMARAAGITTASTKLLEEGGRAHFMSRRFDRRYGRKLHMQSLCALAGVDFRLRGTNDYAQYLACVEDLGLGDEAKTEALRRATFNIAAMNCDDHSKNFAFLLPQDSPWEIAPAFDLTFAYNPRVTWTSQHLMGVNGKFRGIVRDDLLVLADRFAVPRAASAIDSVLDAVDSWGQFAASAGLAAPQRDHIASHFPLDPLRPPRRRGGRP